MPLPLCWFPWCRREVLWKDRRPVPEDLHKRKDVVLVDNPVVHAACKSTYTKGAAHSGRLLTARRTRSIVKKVIASNAHSTAAFSIMRCIGVHSLTAVELTQSTALTLLRLADFWTTPQSLSPSAPCGPTSVSPHGGNSTVASSVVHCIRQHSNTC